MLKSNDTAGAQDVADEVKFYDDSIYNDTMNVFVENYVRLSKTFVLQ